MAKTLAELQTLLTTKGFLCRKVLDVCLVTDLPTQAYRNAAGRKKIKVQLTFDHHHDCLTLDTPWAFDSRLAAHKEAMLACLLSASAHTPLVKTQLDPADGEVRLRIDCRCGGEGIDADVVVQMLSLIPQFADRWYPHIKSAMEKGNFDPAGSSPSPADLRLQAIARRAGGINRLEALLRLRKKDG